MSQNLNGHVGEGDGSSSISSSSYESSFDPGEDEYKDINEDHKEESPQDVSGLLTHLNEMETKIIAQKAAEGNMNSEDTQQVLRQLSQLKVDLLTPSQHKASIGKTSRSRSSSRGRSLSSTGGSQHSSRSSSPGGRIGGPETGIVIMDPTHAPTLDDDTRSTRSRSAGRRVPRRGRKNAILEDDALQNSSHSIYSRGRALPRSSSDRSLRLDELAESSPAENQQGKLHQSWSGPAELHRSWSGSVGSLGRPRLGRPAKNKRFEPISTGSLHKPSVGRSDDIGPEPTFPMLGASVNIRYNDDESIGVGSQVYSRHGMARGSGHSVLSSDTKSTISAVREDRRLQAFEDKLAENDGYFPDLDKQPRSGPIRKSSAIWNIISNLVTFPIADPCICKEGHGAKKAWREKFTIFLIFLIASGAFVATVTVLPLYVCVESEEYYDQEQVARRGWTTIHGKVYNMKDYADIHPGGRTSMERYYGEDASKLFPRIPPAELPNYCLSNLLNETVFNETNSLGIQNVTCGYQSPEDQLRFSSPEGACHLNIVGGDDITEKFEEYYEGEWVIPGWDLGRKIKMEYIVIDDLVYNITGYIENLMQDGGLTLNINHKTNEFAYLAEALHVLVVNQRNGDATNIFYDLFRSPEDQEAVKL